jgi:hypothetical protein
VASSSCLCHRRCRRRLAAGDLPASRAQQRRHHIFRTCGLTGGGISITCRRSRANTPAPARSPAQPPQWSGRHSIFSSGSSTSIFVAPGAPRGLPPLPEPGMERLVRSRPSDDGRRELFDESVPNRSRNCAISARKPLTSAVNAAITAACSVTNATRSSYDGRCGPKPDTQAPCHTNPPVLIKVIPPDRRQDHPQAGHTPPAHPTRGPACPHRTSEYVPSSRP